MCWKLVKDGLPPVGVTVETKLDDGQGVRCVQKLTIRRNLWFCNNGTYIYYKPTHWRHIN